MQCDDHGSSALRKSPSPFSVGIDNRVSESVHRLHSRVTEWPLTDTL